MEKEFGFSFGPHCFNALSPPVLVSEVINKVARYYSRFLFKQADVFHAACIEQKIAQLDIIILQAANWAPTLKAALA